MINVSCYVERKYVICGGTIFSEIFQQFESNSIQVTLGEKQKWQCCAASSPPAVYLTNCSILHSWVLAASS